MAIVEIAVLGPLRIRVDGHDVTERLPETQRALLAVLAGVSEPLAKIELRRRVGLAPSSIDPQLSKLRSNLGVTAQLLRTRWPRPGYLALNRDVVAVDADAFLRLVDRGTRAYEARQYESALTELVTADDLWRGKPFGGVTLPSDTGDVSPVTQRTATLLRARRRSRELAAHAWLQCGKALPVADRFARWATELVDSDVCWFAATRAALDTEGASAARTVLSSWRAGGLPGESRATHPLAVAERLIKAVETGATEPPVIADESRHDVVSVLLDVAARAAVRFDQQAVVELCSAALEHASVSAHGEILLSRADAYRLLGQWDAAETDLVAAANAARANHDVIREAEATLAVAWVSWDPDRFGGSLEQRLEELLEALPPDQESLRLQLEACLSGGLYQDGTVDVARSERFARHALERVGELDDPLIAAQVLSQARKGLIDIDPPEVQLERSKRIQTLGSHSPHHRCLGHLATTVDLLHLGRVDDARAETELHRAAAFQTKSRLHAYQQAALDAMWSLYDGRFADAQSQTDLAERLSEPFTNITVAQVVFGQRIWRAYESGDTAELRSILAVVDRFASVETELPVWSCAAAFFHAALDALDTVRSRLHALARETHCFRDLERGPLRIAVLAFAAGAAARLAFEGDDVRDLGSALHDELAAHDCRAVLVGWPVIYLGSKRRWEGLAALAAGYQDIAIEELSAACSDNRTDGPIRTRTLIELSLAQSM